MNIFSLENKTALVTGGNRGLGSGIAKGLAKAGAKVVIMASSDSVFDAAKKMGADGLQILPVKCDLSNETNI